MQSTEAVTLVAVLAGTTVVSLLVLAVAVRRLLVICPPNRLAVLSGRPHRGPAGQPIGYRLCRAGRVLRIPLLERLDWMDLTPMAVDGTLERVSLADRPGGFDLDFAAQLGVTSDPVRIHRAVERFLERPRADVERVARETLEGTLRTVLSRLEPAQVTGDLPHLLQLLHDEAELNLGPLGIDLLGFTLRRLEPRRPGGPAPRAVPPEG